MSPIVRILLISILLQSLLQTNYNYASEKLYASNSFHFIVQLNIYKQSSRL